MSSIGRRAFARILLLSGLVAAGACERVTPTAVATPPRTPGFSIDQTAYYVIRNVQTRKVMDVESSGCCNGYLVHQWTYEGRTNQQWRIVDVGGGYYRVIARHSNRVLDVKSASLSDGAKVHQWGYDGSANQQFAFLYVGGGGASGTPEQYSIMARHSGKVLVVSGGSTYTGPMDANGVGIRQYGVPTNYGLWQLEKVQ
jgi:hypothetical protein